jgi:hypothetical protein
MDHIIEQINKINDENINELEELYYKLKKTTSKRLLSYLFYTLKNFDPSIIETTEEKVKRKDKQFRDKVKSFYNNKCIISGRSEIVCEVAHIKPFSESDPEEKYDQIMVFYYQLTYINYLMQNYLQLFLKHFN